MNQTRIQCRAIPRTQAHHTRPGRDRGRLAEESEVDPLRGPPLVEEEPVLTQTADLGPRLVLHPTALARVRAPRPLPDGVVAGTPTLPHHPAADDLSLTEYHHRHHLAADDLSLTERHHRHHPLEEDQDTMTVGPEAQCAPSDDTRKACRGRRLQ